MAVGTQYYTTEEFDAFVCLPEHADRRFELIGGEIVEVVSNNYLSLVAMRIGARLLVFFEGKQLGYVTGADGGYVVSGERYIPGCDVRQQTAPARTVARCLQSNRARSRRRSALPNR